MNKCYNNNKETDCQSPGGNFYGQDAQYAALGTCSQHSFSIDSTVENEKVVVDNNTGLQWQQAISAETYTWKNAYAHCDTLNYGGHSDWRLPNPQELLTIVDISQYNYTGNTFHPAVDTTYFPNLFNNKEESGYLWSSAIYYYGSQNRPYYLLSSGIIQRDAYSYSSGISENSALSVICTRGNELPYASFTTLTAENGETVIKDSVSGLIWQGTYKEGTDLTWHKALSYCENLTCAGYSDWRVPNKNESASLINQNKSAPYSDFPGITSDWFWSSTTYAGETGNAWVMSTYYGDLTYLNNKTISSNVRCVR